jgi:hypothetical protein
MNQFAQCIDLSGNINSKLYQTNHVTIYPNYDFFSLNVVKEWLIEEKRNKTS